MFITSNTLFCKGAVFGVDLYTDIAAGKAFAAAARRAAA